MLEWCMPGAHTVKEHLRHRRLTASRLMTLACSGDGSWTYMTTLALRRLRDIGDSVENADADVRGWDASAITSSCGPTTGRVCP